MRPTFSKWWALSVQPDVFPFTIGYIAIKLTLHGKDSPAGDWGFLCHTYNNFGKHDIAYMFTFISLAVQVSMRKSCDTAICKTRWECNTYVIFIL